MNDFVNPAQQAMDLIRKIGDDVSQSGQPIRQIPVPARDKFRIQLIDELVEHGIIKITNVARSFKVTQFLNVNLTLEGWERYEQEKRGDFQSNYGFIAMQFNDPVLDVFVENTVKPFVKEDTGYNLVDMRDVATAGLIDNIMRVRIRDAAFVIADLTHDNRGAYWEAGYAEGLGKPVIYICERAKFKKDRTHFDTNHCTTILWSKEEPEKFREKLVATLRRSLDDLS